MSYSFSKSPEYDSSDKISVDIRMDGDNHRIQDIVQTFVSFLQAAGYDKDNIVNAFADLAEDYLDIPLRDDMIPVGSIDVGGYPTELL